MSDFTKEELEKIYLMSCYYASNPINQNDNQILLMNKIQSIIDNYHNTKVKFTYKQIDHICYQIGEWYLMMKPLLEGQHNLGYMKEKLKTMICGDDF